MKRISVLSVVSLSGCTFLTGALSVECGDGFVQSPTEQCDDGNTDALDGCDDLCQLEDGAVCGDGIISSPEQCDDGNTNNGDGCDSDCFFEVLCGNDRVDPPEGCDDGNLVDGDGCSSSCVIEGCGNTILDVGEECDDGNTIDGDGCESDCTLGRCGNGIAAPGEVCLFGPISTKKKPQGLAVVDINNNDPSDLDLIITERGDSITPGTLSVYAGDGDGTFGTPIRLAAGLDPSSLVVANFVGGASLDIAVTNEASGNIFLFIGDGSGFSGPTTIITNSGPDSIAALRMKEEADADDFDLAITSATNEVSLFTNLGATFSSPNDFSTGGLEPNFVFIADLNDDANDDIIVTNESSNDVSVLLSNGNGTFEAATRFPCGVRPREVAVGTINADSFVDLVVANEGGETVSVLLGDGNGNFADHVEFTVGSKPSSLVSLDLDEDGDFDIATANNGDNTVSVLASDGAGNFAAQRIFAVGTSPVTIRAGDIDKDGRKDLLVANSDAQSISRLFQRPDNSFTPSQSLFLGGAVSAGTIEATTGDVNNDGNLDLLVTHQDESKLSVLLGDGTGAFLPQSKIPLLPINGPRGVVLTHLNPSIDGNLDLIVALQNTNELGFALGVGDGSFAQLVKRTAGVGPCIPVAEDFNEDGFIDVIVSNTVSNNISVFFGDGFGGLAPAINFGAFGTSTFGLVAEDLDSDADVDLIVTSAAGITLLINDAFGGFTSGPPIAVQAGAVMTAVGRLNEDIFLDLVVVNHAEDTISIILSDGALSFGSAVSISVGEGPIFALIEDFNNDGDGDIVVGLREGNELKIFPGNGNGTFDSAILLEEGMDDRQSLVTGDFNNDSLLDLASTHFRNGVRLTDILTIFLSRP